MTWGFDLIIFLEKSELNFLKNINKNILSEKILDTRSYNIPRTFMCPDLCISDNSLI